MSEDVRRNRPSSGSGNRQRRDGEPAQRRQSRDYDDEPRQRRQNREYDGEPRRQSHDQDGNSRRQNRGYEGEPRRQNHGYEGEPRRDGGQHRGNGNGHGPKRMNKAEKLRRTLMYIGFVICGILALTEIATIVCVAKLNVLTVKLFILMFIVFVLITAVFAIMNRWTIPGIFSKTLSIILIAVLIVGCYYMTYTYNKAKDFTGENMQIDDVSVYVMATDSAQSLTDTTGYTYGILSTLDRENTDTYKADIESKLGTTLNTNEYSSAVDLAAALYTGQSKAIIMNAAYESIIESVDQYANFATDTKKIDTTSIESEVQKTEENEEYLKSNANVFTIYISGIDTRGSSPNVNSNSDVNILLTVNLKTRQVLLISTPRDYYVPLSISNGQNDKLTHAGGYGVDVSMDTLEMLYGVNVDDYLKINFTGFIDVIDALGGVDVYSDQAFTGDGGFTFVEGTNHLNGEQALSFARERHSFSGGDRKRGEHQMLVIEAIIKKMATSSALANYTQILDSISDCMVTSMSYDRISELVKFQLNDMRGWDVQKYSVNGSDSSSTTYSTGSQYCYVMIPDQATVDTAKSYLKQIYNGETVTVTTEATE